MTFLDCFFNKVLGYQVLMQRFRILKDLLTSLLKAKLDGFRRPNISYATNLSVLYRETSFDGMLKCHPYLKKILQHKDYERNIEFHLTTIKMRTTVQKITTKTILIQSHLKNSDRYNERTIGKIRS